MSINRSTTWNDSVMPGYRVTKFPVNLMAWQMLPDRTIRNWADMTSYTQYNKPNMTPLEGFLANNILNPNHISQWDPMLFTLGCPQMNQYSSTTNPLLTQMGISNAYNMGVQYAMNNRINSMIQNIARTLGSLESQLTNLIDNDQLTDSQKAKLEAKLEEIHELKERIQEFLAQGQPTLEDLQAISGEVIELQRSITELIEEIRREVQSSNDDDDDAVDDGDDASNNDDNNNNDLNCDENGRPSSLGAAPDNSFLRTMCDTFNEAVNYFWGTDNDKFYQVLNAIDANNVVEVMQYWNKNYGNDSDNTFLDNFLGDAEHYEKREYGTKILNALITRAEANGIEAEIAEDVSAARSEFNDCNISKHLIKRYITNIFNKIVAKEKANADEVANRSNQADADRQQDADNAAAEAKATFLADMREIWEDDQLEINDKVKYSDGKFTVRILGENYSATSFKALVKKIERDDLDPKKYLAKQRVDARA